MKLTGKVGLVLVGSLLLTLGLSFLPSVDELAMHFDEPEPVVDLVTSVVAESGGVEEVWFCPQDNCSAKLSEIILSANSAVWCAFYDLDLEDVTSALENRFGELGNDSVVVVIDEDNEDEYSAPFVSVNTGSALMHHKICVIDGMWVTTGSFNPTIRGATLNDNNLVLVRSSSLAKLYTDQILEAELGVKKDKTREGVGVTVELDGVLVEHYFCPDDDCAAEIMSELREADQSIVFMTFSFTHDAIGALLVSKFHDGVQVEGIMEARQVTKHSVFELLDFQGIDVVRDNNKANMHHKFFVIDNETVITGSFNPSQNAAKRNDENVLIIHSPPIAQLFLEEYERKRGKS